VGPGAGLDGCGKSRPTGIRSPDLPARSESLYRLRYPGSHIYVCMVCVYIYMCICIYIYIYMPFTSLSMSSNVLWF
jgi:hypothetical protein